MLVLARRGARADRPGRRRGATDGSADRAGQRRRPLQRRDRPGQRRVPRQPAAGSQPPRADQRRDGDRRGERMSIWGALAGGFVGTLVLTTILRAASELRLTRMDLPFLLGTAFTANRLRAKALGYALHFLAGLIFALLYYAIFVAIGESGWWARG